MKVIILVLIILISGCSRKEDTLDAVRMIIDDCSPGSTMKLGFSVGSYDTRFIAECISVVPEKKVNHE